MESEFSPKLAHALQPANLLFDQRHEYRVCKVVHHQRLLLLAVVPLPVVRLEVRQHHRVDCARSGGTREYKPPADPEGARDAPAQHSPVARGCVSVSVSCHRVCESTFSVRRAGVSLLRLLAIPDRATGADSIDAATCASKRRESATQRQRCKLAHNV